ncbi:encapsulin [Paraburkholderia terrae]|uniref:encapsulin n=1 Tax=Paraburkholderia terrae TaxID=311230 RepID=UPI00296AABFC|nr:encapsulin [Paraburkholderia terrae]MDW3660579.1 encapsulin [Paraburkholderia terrae]
MDTTLGRSSLPWKDGDTWNSIDKAVADEHTATAVAAKFLTPPVFVAQDAPMVQADALDPKATDFLKVDQTAQVNIVEIWVEFKLTDQQVANEVQWKTTVTLATGAANLLARAEDLLIFQGSDGVNDSLFQDGIVKLRDASREHDILKPPFPIVGLLPADQKISVDPVNGNPTDPNKNSYGENTYAAVANGYALLQQQHYGRQALVLPTTAYADAYAAVTTALSIPAINADRLKGLLGGEKVLYGASTLPTFGTKKAPAKGVLVALDGITMDLVVAMAPTVEVLPKDSSGLYAFRVFERFAFRLKDKKAVVELDFNQSTAG